MRSLTEVHREITAQDAELEKQAAEMLKVAEEHDAAGRIMARGFADELHKLADAYGSGYDPFSGGRGGRKGGGAPNIAPAGDTNASGQAYNSRKTKMNPVTGASFNPGAGKAPAAPKPKITLGAGTRPPKAQGA